MPPPVQPPEPAPTGYPEYVLVWPEHAASIGFWILALATLVLLAWWFLRGQSCWICGREKGMCPHTREQYGGE